MTKSVYDTDGDGVVDDSEKLEGQTLAQVRDHTPAVHSHPKCSGSNASFHDEDCSDISDWIDGDSGTAESSQVTFDGKSCFKFDTGGSAGSTNKARRNKDVGTFGDKVVIECDIYLAACGTSGDGDVFRFFIEHADVRCIIVFGTDGIFVFDGASYNEVGVNIVQSGVWQSWLFDIDFSVPASAVVDVYLNDVMHEEGVDCSDIVGSFDLGMIYIHMAGDTTTDRIAYLDFIKIGDDCT